MTKDDYGYEDNISHDECNSVNENSTVTSIPDKDRVGWGSRSNDRTRGVGRRPPPGGTGQSPSPQGLGQGTEEEVGEGCEENYVIKPEENFNLRPPSGAAGRPRGRRANRCDDYGVWNNPHNASLRRLTRTTQRGAWHANDRARNTGRGLRSHEAVAWRKYWRNVKKNMARRDRRRERSRQASLALRAQEPGAGSERTVYGPGRAAAGRVGPPRVRPGMKLRVASLNIQGMKVVMKREEVEAWMIKRNIQVTVVQETHIPTTGVERKKRVTWYFSGLKG